MHERKGIRVGCLILGSGRRLYRSKEAAQPTFAYIRCAIRCTGTREVMEATRRIGNLAKKQNRESVANYLGWFSIGLGVVQLLAPRTLSCIIGIKPRPLLLRLLGLRE